MKNYTVKELQAEFKNKGYKWSNDLQIIGIRTKNSKPNLFNDLFYVIKQDTIVFKGAGTTISGKHWLLNPMNTKGTAVLKSGQYQYKLGTHNGYEAFVQAAPVIVFRDNDKDEIAEETTTLDTGWFGINIHRAAKGWISKFVDKWSAGCQVWQDSVLFEQIVAVAKGSGQKTFNYTLLKEF